MLSAIGGLLSWDQETMMPAKSGSARAEQSAAIAGVIHEKFVNPETGKLLRELYSKIDSLSPVEAANIRERLRDYEKSTRLPSALVRDLARAASLAQASWIEARKKSEFSIFAPWLKKTVELKRKQAQAYGYEDHPYDALLDDYEPQMTVKELDPIMEELRLGLIPMVKAICESKINFDTKAILGKYPAHIQQILCHELMESLGVDRNASRLDQSAHPFCAGISPPDDVRITTRFDECDFSQAFYSVLHESGHALYEQGLLEKYFGTPMAESVSLGIHESQSRLWENIIGRSLPFIRFILPRIKRRFPGMLKNMTPKVLFGIVNHVSPNLIRIESDEVTYNPHIMLRYEIEKNLLTGDIKVKDLPSVWNEMMNKYLGIRPKKDAEGVLQDTHWASGLFGYFPTYLLGNIYSAQLWHRILIDIPHVESMILKGRFRPILDWLRTKIHRHGRRYSPKELLRKTTGNLPDGKYLLEYLGNKYGKIYDVSL